MYVFLSAFGYVMFVSSEDEFGDDLIGGVYVAWRWSVDEGLFNFFSEFGPVGFFVICVGFWVGCSSEICFVALDDGYDGKVVGHESDFDLFASDDETVVISGEGGCWLAWRGILV